MSVSEISRALHLDQKPLYRRIERHLRALREQLERGGFHSDIVDDLLGDRGVVLDFRLRKLEAQ